MSAAAAWSLGLARWAAELGRDLQRPVRALGGPRELWRVLRVDAATVARLCALRADINPARVRERLGAVGIVHISPGDARWPDALAALPDPPFGLFVRGDADETLASLAAAPVVSLVGSRRASARGRVFAHSLAGGLARAGAVVVSGLAYGIDAAVHEGVLSADGVTVAVLGCGVDVVYPRRHRALADRIMNRGLLMSEYWPGTPPAPWRFPARNRIVAGLAGAVGVIEAGERSGALITADFALEVGRPVLAVPGWPTDSGARGCNALLRAGAALLEDRDDLIHELPGARWRVESPMGGIGPADDAHGLAGRILAALAREPLSADALGEQLGEGAATVAGTLAVLEVDGAVVRDDAQRYLVVPRAAPGVRQ
ncbi:MAG TPA: DNA-processing protein DprA [Miltoncostaeaceae bacterium]|nr:DNA-processing protein DprA [Miltoncostaeaceae bacterium]